MRCFLDTSSLAKLYHSEADSAALRAQIQLTDELFVAELAWLELHSAFGRKVRRGDLPQAQADISLRAFGQDWPAFTHVPLSWHLLEEATRLLTKHAAFALRSLDATQLAAALAAGPLDAFFTHDQRLRAAALAKGLLVR